VLRFSPGDFSPPGQISPVTRIFLRSLSRYSARASRTVCPVVPPSSSRITRSSHVSMESRPDAFWHAFCLEDTCCRASWACVTRESGGRPHRRSRRGTRYPQKTMKGEDTVFPEHRDLCSTCEHVRTCSHRSTPAKPISSCQGYREYVPACSADRPQRAPERGGDSGGFAGLCASCQLRWTCLFPKAEGGVWHCEEYC